MTTLAPQKRTSGTLANDTATFPARRTRRDKTSVLSQESRHWIEYVNMIIFEFADGYKLPLKEAYSYLKQYGGIDFLNEFYDVEHTENPYYTVRTLLRVCRNHGGGGL